MWGYHGIGTVLSLWPFKAARTLTYSPLLPQLIVIGAVSKMFDESSDSISFRSSIMRPRLRAEGLVSLQEVLVRASVGEASSSHPQILHKAEVLDLSVKNYNDSSIYTHKKPTTNTLGLFHP